MAPPAAARGRATLALAAATALARPGTWQAFATESDVGFRIVGAGVCRTASGGAGTFDSVESPTTAADCERRCAEDTDCLAYEVDYNVESATFNPGRVNSCELHKEAIMTAKPQGKNECWVKEGRGRKRDYALIGTGYCLPARLDRFQVAAWDFAPPGSFAHHYQCRTACDAEAACTSYELRKDGGRMGCKLYTDTDPITQVEPCEKGRDCWCWVAKPLAKPEPAGNSSSMGATSEFW